MELILLTPFLIGLASSLHCVGMCGGIIGALSLSLPATVRSNRSLMFGYLLAYSIGRISSYGLAGALVGGLSGGLFGFISPQFGHTLLRVLAAVLLVGIGLYLAGWFPKFARLEKIGQPLWRRLEPLGQRLLPVRSALQALGFGFIWGWLPCGLVYSTLLWSAASGSPTNGALYMLAFGLGTLPAVLATGAVAGWVARLPRLPAARAAIGVALIVFGLASLWFAPDHTDHAGHTPTTAPAATPGVAPNDTHQLQSHPHP